MNIEKNKSLLLYNTFGINAQTQLFAEVRSEEDFQQLIQLPEYQSNDKLVLGGGSNILLTRDFKGIVIKNSLKGIEFVKEDEEHAWVKAAAGEIWHELVLFCIENGLGGIENLSLIPGQVGAAPMQNIGAYGVELKEVFESLEALDVKTGEKRIFTNVDCEFGYRESVFKTSLKGKYLITSVTLRLSKHPQFNTSYGAIKQTLEEEGVKELSLKAVSDAVIKIRQSKLPDPKVLGNAGSFFKNPEIPTAQFEALKEKFPEVPSYPLPGGMVKVPAGWLIEHSGWKGKRVGNTGSHKDQALVLVNYGNATGNEVRELSNEIIVSIREKFGIDLKPEVNII